MPEVTNQQVLPDVNVNPKRETVEILDSTGNNAQQMTPLSAIFDKMETGLSAEEAAQELSKKKAKADDPPAPDANAPANLPEKKDDPPAPTLEEGLRDRQAAKDAPVVPDAHADDIPDDDLKVLPGDKPKTAKRIQALLKKVEEVRNSEATTKKELEARDLKLKELEEKLTSAKPATQEVDEAVKQQLDELKMFRRRYELDKDPEVKQKFDDRITAAEKPVEEILARNGASEALIKSIKEEGGWLRFSQSTRPINLKDGTHTAAEVADLIVQNLPFADRQTVQAVSMEQITTKREKERFYEEQLRTANDFFKKKEEESQRGTVEHQKRLEEAKKAVEEWHKQVVVENEWLKEKPVPKDATPEQKAAIEDDNRHTKQINEHIVKALNATQLQDLLSIVKDSASYYQERRLHARTMAERDAAKKEVEKLKGEIDRFKKASSSVPRPGSLLAERSSPDNKPSKPASLEDALDLIAAGKDPNAQD